MNLVWSLIGIMAIWTCLKFVFLVFKRLGNKNRMNDLIEQMEDKMAEGADTVAGYIKKNRKKPKEEERPIVTIR